MKIGLLEYKMNITYTIHFQEINKLIIMNYETTALLKVIINTFT